MSTNLFLVHIGPYAERHFIKSFEKKYPWAWDITLRAIIAQLERIDMFLKTTKAEIITSNGTNHIVKCEFSVAGSRESAHASGNRYIVFLDTEHAECEILLLYGKDHATGNETVWWKEQIKNNYPKIKELFTSL